MSTARSPSSPDASSSDDPSGSQSPGRQQPAVGVLEAAPRRLRPDGRRLRHRPANPEASPPASTTHSTTRSRSTTSTCARTPGSASRPTSKPIAKVPSQHGDRCQPGGSTAAAPATRPAWVSATRGAPRYGALVSISRASHSRFGQPFLSAADPAVGSAVRCRPVRRQGVDEHRRSPRRAPTQAPRGRRDTDSPMSAGADRATA